MDRERPTTAGRPRRGKRTTPPAATPRPVHALPAPPATEDPPVVDPRAVPDDLAEHGRRLWRSVTDDYELEQHETELLEQAARTADLVEALRVALSDGALLTTDGKIRPEIVELRQQRQMLARLLAALRVPLGTEQDDAGHGPARLQRRGAPRGAYRPRSIS